MKLLLFKVHKDDVLDVPIEEVTDTSFVHAALLVDELTNMISEAYFPHVRRRQLADSELAGIAVFDISTTFPQLTPLSDAQVAGVLAHCAQAEKDHEGYAVANLIRFLPLGRALLGQATDNGLSSEVFCSQYAEDSLSIGAGLKLLNADSFKLAPGYLQWSPLLFPAPPLKPLGIGTAGTPSLATEIETVVEEIKGKL